MKRMLINYEQLQELFEKHDVDKKVETTYSAMLYEKVFTYLACFVLLFLGGLLFLTFLPIVIIEAIGKGIYLGFRKGLQDAKEKRNKSD